MDESQLVVAPPRRRTWLRVGVLGLAVGAALAVASAAPRPRETVAQLSKTVHRALDDDGAAGRSSTSIAARKVVYGDMDPDDVQALFNKFADDNARSYESDEERTKRFVVFKKNLQFIDTLNINNPHALYGVTQYADWTSDEVKRMKLPSSFANYTKTKRVLVERGYISEDTLRQVEDPDVDPEDIEDDVARRNLRDEARKADGKTWKDGLDMKHSADTAYAITQGEVEWMRTRDCAACALDKTFALYTLGGEPTNFDWRDLGAVTAVKNQAECGSCWSFSTCGDVEGTKFLGSGGTILHSLSEQQLVACNTMNMGCDGGYPFAAMQYAAHFGGLVHLEDYEYKAINEGSSGTPSCDTATLNSALERDDVAHVGGWQFVAMGDKYEKKMPLALVKNGPLSVSFNANGMEFYVEGIVGCTTGRCKSGAIDHEVPCDPDSLDHAVLIVGYGVQEGDQDEVTHMNDDVDWEDDDINYWVIKNSWGSEWGEAGYYRLVRGTNACGVANMVVHSVYKAPGP